MTQSTIVFDRDTAITINGMSELDYQYKLMLSALLDRHDQGLVRQTRNDPASASIFGYQYSIAVPTNLMPILTTKRVHFRSILVELLWFLRGSTNIKWLHDYNVSIWDEWADDEGNLGPVYGKQWRSWAKPDGTALDQLDKTIRGIIDNPFGRRHIVTAWNPVEVDDMALPPCHCLFQFYVEDDGALSLKLYQRSGDVFLGVPFNVTSYALLLKLVAAAVGRKTGMFHHTFGDLHLYSNHVDQAREQVKRKGKTLLPILRFAKRDKVWEYEPEDFELVDYVSEPAIKAEVSR